MQSGSTDPTHLRKIQASFGEIESIGGVLNHRHRELRERVDASDTVPAADYRQMFDQHGRLGATGDAARVLLIPGATGAFAAAEARRVLRRLQVSWWHRRRLVVGVWLDRRRVRHEDGA